jgi:hypothetical protein
MISFGLNFQLISIQIGLSSGILLCRINSRINITRQLLHDCITIQDKKLQTDKNKSKFHKKINSTTSLNNF